MTSFLRDDGTYCGPGGPDPQKTQAQRTQELLAMLDSEDGRDIIVCLWEEVHYKSPSPATLNCSFISLPPPPDGMIRSPCIEGTSLNVPHSATREMISDILNYEYPNGSG